MPENLDRPSIKQMIEQGNAQCDRVEAQLARLDERYGPPPRPRLRLVEDERED
jgi:hypothetical protein